MIEVEHKGRYFATSEARIVSGWDELPREVAALVPDEPFNSTYVWVSGRFVQSGQANLNGHFWETEDLQRGNPSIRHSPLNVNHDYSRPVGTIVASEVVRTGEFAADGGENLYEIQVLGAVWAANFPSVASLVRLAHEEARLYMSMECISESVQCRICNKEFAFATPRVNQCEHLATSSSAPRRLKNPTFLGGALILPPEQPAWPDAEVFDIAKFVTASIDKLNDGVNHIPPIAWSNLMNLALSDN